MHRLALGAALLLELASAITAICHVPRASMDIALMILAAIGLMTGAT